MEGHLCLECTGDNCDDADLKVRAGVTLECSGFLEDNGIPVGSDSCATCGRLEVDKTMVPQGDQMVPYPSSECGAGRSEPDEGKRCDDYLEA